MDLTNRGEIDGKARNHGITSLYDDEQCYFSGESPLLEKFNQRIRTEIRGFTFGEENSKV